MSEYFKIDYNQDGWPIVTMDNEDIGRKKILQLLNSKTQEIEQLKKENESMKKDLREGAAWLAKNHDVYMHGKYLETPGLYIPLTTNRKV